MQEINVTVTDLSKNAITVLEKRYLLRDENKKLLETPEELFWRVSNAIGDNEEEREKFYDIMISLRFLPNSPTLMNAGTKLGQLSACYVLPIEDDMTSIFEAVKNSALIHQGGGGTGFAFSRLRPKNDVVKTTGGIASGPISFMEVFNAATNTVKQGGRRRGANMGILRVDHPDIMEFITCKEEQTRFTNFNISVAVTESFMKSVENNEDYDLINPRNNKTMGKLNAKEVFNKIIELAWKNGEPGIVFIDRINRDNPTPAVGEIESTNPCGEMPLLPWESCNLGSINLSKHVSKGKISWELLEKTIRTSIRFLDNIIDKNSFILPQIEEMTKANRKIGLGVMGFADLLVKVGIRYNSTEAIEKAEEIMSFIQSTARDESAKLGKERGDFANFEKSTLKAQYDNMRNATVTTIAPTGTISLIAGCSSGIEPYYAIAFTRNVLGGKKLFDVNHLFEEKLKKAKLYSEELIETISATNSIQEIDELPMEIRDVFVTSHDIEPEWHIEMQAAFQKYIDNATSKTINFPSTASKEDISKTYLLAYKKGCKGVTVYRDGSRKYQVLTTKKTEKVAEQDIKVVITDKVVPRPRPEVTIGRTHKIRAGCGNLYVTINRDETGVCEVFVQVGKSGGCIASQSEAVGRLISLALRSGVRLESITDHLAGIRCPSPNFYQGKTVLSCADGIAHVLESYIDGAQIIRPNGTVACPECGGMLEFAEGCYTCRSCGYSKCD
ncbi:MAG: vitamin B12-dependent ribonucleotide reductase [Asgard group archaeon]|nr:vitamin B12-dependent ribonucleotide reductase [Asgard group archaeon]